MPPKATSENAKIQARIDALQAQKRQASEAAEGQPPAKAPRLDGSKGKGRAGEEEDEEEDVEYAWEELEKLLKKEGVSEKDRKIVDELATEIFGPQSMCDLDQLFNVAASHFAIQDHALLASLLPQLQQTTSKTAQTVRSITTTTSGKDPKFTSDGRELMKKVLTIAWASPSVSKREATAWQVINSAATVLLKDEYCTLLTDRGDKLNKTSAGKKWVKDEVRKECNRLRGRWQIALFDSSGNNPYKPQATLTIIQLAGKLLPEGVIIRRERLALLALLRTYATSEDRPARVDKGKPSNEEDVPLVEEEEGDEDGGRKEKDGESGMENDDSWWKWVDTQIAEKVKQEKEKSKDQWMKAFQSYLDSVLELDLATYGGLELYTREFADKDAAGETAEVEEVEEAFQTGAGGSGAG